MDRSHPPFLESTDTGQSQNPLGSFPKLLSLCWNMKEDPSKNVAGVGGEGGGWVERNYSSPCPSQFLAPATVSPILKV